METLVPYGYDPLPETLTGFLEAMESLELRFLSTDLLIHFGFDDEHSIDHAILRAMQACRSLQLPQSRHFRKIFIIHENGIGHAWKLSALGCYLALVNEDPSHPLVARMQASLLMHLR
ncbi:MAG: hypothetical protein M0P58_12970 [Bacteroidales bacterium]|jgi:hypothetical protein|nr:hypothetical protein [Bacteroidales bacterium]